MNKRIFIAFPLEEGIKKKIVTWVETFKATHNIPVRWLKPENLHITLVPPFYVHDEELKMVKLLIAQTVHGVLPFEIEFQKVTYGPDPKRPRLIWASAETPPDMQRLKNILEQTLVAAKLDIIPEQRPLKVHLTLARFREESFSTFKIQELNEEVRWYGILSKIAIMESVFKLGGAEYYIINQYELF